MEKKYEEMKNQVLLDELTRLKYEHESLKTEMIQLLNEYDKKAERLLEIEKDYIKINEILKNRIE